MQVSWVISSEYKDDKATPEQLKAIGNTWGSWKTWRSYSTTNVLCTNNEKARDLIKRAFHSVCNFYIPQKSYAALGRPPGVQVFDGQFPGDFDNQEDIVAMHLVSKSDLVLLLGFNLAEVMDTDATVKHLKKSYQAAACAVIKNNLSTQWVVIDHLTDLDKIFSTVENITCDTYESVLQLLGDLNLDSDT